MFSYNFGQRKTFTCVPNNNTDCKKYGFLYSFPPPFAFIQTFLHVPQSIQIRFFHIGQFIGKLRPVCLILTMGFFQRYTPNGYKLHKRKRARISKCKEAEPPRTRIVRKVRLTRQFGILAAELMQFVPVRSIYHG